MKTRSRSLSAGYTLIELLVAMAVASVSAAAIGTGFIGLNRLMYVQEGVRAGQASLRQSLNMIERQLRIAGYGIEPWLAFDFPNGWSGTGYYNSDHLIFRSRDPRFARKVKPGTVSNGALDVTDPLPVTLKAGQIVQIMCPNAATWTYAQLSADAPAGTSTLQLQASIGKFPRTNSDLGTACYNGIGGDFAYVFKIDVYDYTIEMIDDDGIANTPPQPFLFRHHGLGGTIGEPVADNVEVLRVQFLHADKNKPGQLINFTPDPNAAPSGAPNTPTSFSPTPSLANYDLLPTKTAWITDNPDSIVAIRVGIVARSGVVDQELRKAKLENVIPAFQGRPAIIGTAVSAPNPPVAEGFRRVIFETTVHLHNLQSITMFMPPFTNTPLGACNGTAPTDGLNCISG